MKNRKSGFLKISGADEFGKRAGNHVRRWNLLEQLTIRAIKTKYKNSYFGALLSFVDPLISLVAFTVVFGVIFNSKLRASGEEDRITFVIGLYLGIVLYELIAECMAQSAVGLVTQPGFVKKVIFPLEILPLATVCAAIFQALLNMSIMFMVMIGLQGRIPLSALYLPLILIPYFIFLIGVGWWFSAAGIFFRDLSVFITPLRMFLLYSSAIFYSIERVPEFLKPLIECNPLGFTVYECRKVLIWDSSPDWIHLGMALGIALGVACGGYYFFNRLKSYFSECV